MGLDRCPRGLRAGAVEDTDDSQATPIVVNGVKLYMPTPYGTIICLDPETGKELWSYKLEHSRPAGEP